MDYISYQKQGAIAHIKLNRPKVLNALNEPMFKELFAAFKDADSDPAIRIAIVSGEGRAFSAGVDLKATSSDGFDSGDSFMQLGNELGDMIQQISLVTIAQVHGYCFTGALEFMLFFDLAFCAHETQFGDTHAKWAIMPKWGITQRMSRRVGLHKAKELSFRALRISGQEAASLGLVNSSFPAEKLDEEVYKITTDIIANSHEAICAIKNLYNQGWATTLVEGLDIEQKDQTKLSDTTDNLKAFESKKFSGK